MGFLRADIEIAMQAMQSNETDVVMEYLLNNPRGDEFQTSHPEGESITAAGGVADATGDVPPQDITMMGVEVERVRGGDDVNVALVTTSLAASIGDISTIEREDSMALQDPVGSSSEMPGGINAAAPVQSREGAGSATEGRVVVEAAITEYEQSRSATTRTTTTANGPADVLLLRRDLGQLITELSRLCEEDGTPRPLDPASAPASLSVPVATLDSATLPPSTTFTAELISVPQGNEAPSLPVPGAPIPMAPVIIADEGPRITRARASVSEAQLMLQTLGQQGLQDSDPGSASWLSPLPRGGDDSLVRKGT